MTNDTNSTSRRSFIQGAGVAAVATAALGGTAHAVEIDAMSPTPEQMQAFLALDHDGPIVMVNLLKFKPEGGVEEYAKYSAGVAPCLAKVGAKLLFAGATAACLIGDADWDMVALVEYPKKEALFQMVQTPEYQAIHHHREAGLQGQVNYAVIQRDGL